MRTVSKIEEGVTRPLFMQMIRSHCIPLHAVAADATSEGSLKFTGGSALLWESQVGRYFVTAHHVWRELTDKVNDTSGNFRMFTYDMNGPVLIHKPLLVDESEEHDLAVFTVLGIRELEFAGKVFLRTPNWPTPAITSGEIIVGCGYPGKGRKYEDGRWEFQILVWAHRECSVSQSGTRLLLDAYHGKGKATYFTKSKPGELALPGISGAPLFALRDTLNWVGVVRSGCGVPPQGYSIQATPSGLIGPDGRIRKM